MLNTQNLSSFSISPIPFLSQKTRSRDPSSCFLELEFAVMPNGTMTPDHEGPSDVMIEWYGYEDCGLFWKPVSTLKPLDERLRE